MKSQKKSPSESKKTVQTVLLSFIVILLFPSCATTQSLLAISPTKETNQPIHNPFGDYYAPKSADSGEAMIFRSKKGDRSVEVQLPASTQQMSDLVIPISPAFKDEVKGRSPASSGAGYSMESGIDENYKQRGPTLSDREITQNLPQGLAQDESKRREIEQGLNLSPAPDNSPDHDKSYLAALDHIKQLYRSSRFEAALIEMDDLVRFYQTDSKLYEMRGTLLDRLGKPDLALKSWNQALRFDPSNQKLRRFVERKQNYRSLASP